jgi:dihydropteroate synthase
MCINGDENTAIAHEASQNLLTFEQPCAMGIINLTPDSFYDGGRYAGLESVLRDAEEKVSQGARILDLGAASSRPGAREIPQEEEWLRLEAPLREIRKRFPEVLLSVDTWRAAIAERSTALGANMINDISAGTLDPAMPETVARLQLPYILMHMQGTPDNMQMEPWYDNVEEELLHFFQERIALYKSLGFHKLILDPGFGFGKNNPHNYALLKALPRFRELGYPVLAGISRKSMINGVIGTNPVTALNGTTVLHTIALLNGASILRVHDVREAMQAIQLVSYYQNH